MRKFRNPLSSYDPNDPNAQQPSPPSGGVLAAAYNGGEGQGGQQQQAPPPPSAAAPFAPFGDDKESFLSKLGTFGATMVMMDPMYRSAGAAMLQRDDAQAQQKREDKRMNFTANWLVGQGVGNDEAAYLASDPNALRTWWSAWKAGEKPDWKFQDVATEDGSGTQTWMVDMNHPERRQVVGGVKAQDPLVNNGMIYDRGNKTWSPMPVDPNKAPATSGDRQWDPATHSWTPLPADPNKAPTIETFFDKKSGLEYKGRWNPQTQDYDIVGGTKAPAGVTSFTVDKDGNVTYTQGGSGAGKTTEAEQKTTGYLVRMADAEPDINKYADTTTSFWGNATQMAPGMARKWMQSPEYKMGQRAGRSWLAGVLRGDSGGAITDPEWEDYGDIFIPQFGDDPQQLQQKQRMRASVMTGLKAGMSDAARVKVLDAIAKGGGEPDTGQGGDTTAAAPAGGASPPRLTQQQYNVAPSGTRYTAPDGSIRTKP